MKEMIVSNVQGMLLHNENWVPRLKRVALIVIGGVLAQCDMETTLTQIPSKLTVAVVGGLLIQILGGVASQKDTK